MRILNQKKLDENITARAERDMAEGKLGGAEILVNQNGTRVFHRCFGKFSTNGKPLAGGELYRIASMTKPITGVALMQQVEQGNIDLYAPVSDYLPAFAHMTVGHVENGKPVSDRPARNPLLVYHLVTHTSGLLSGAIYDLPLTMQPLDSLAHAVDFYPSVPLSHDPFQKSEYSCAGFDVAARIIEVVTGKTFGCYLKDNIFTPLGMTDTTFAPSEEQWKRMIVLHDRDKDGHSMDATTAIPGCVYDCVPVTYERAGGGLASTAEDYSRFAEMLLNRGTGRNGSRILSAESIDRMRTPWVPECIQPGRDRWGISVRVVVGDTDGYGVERSAFGWSGAYGTHFWVDPVNEVTAIYLRNSEWDSHGCGSIGAKFETDVTDAFES